MAAEQDHAASPHAFGRQEGPPSDILSHHGRASQVGHTGMSWSGFRPSDDACQYHYLVPANMLAVVALARLAALPLCDAVLAARARALASDIRAGIAAHGLVDHPRFGTIYACEADGLGHHTLMDDANVPSLLAAPYLGFCRVDDPVYLATRAFVLSEGNPYFYAGKAATGTAQFAGGAVLGIQEADGTAFRMLGTLRVLGDFGHSTLAGQLSSLHRGVVSGNGQPPSVVTDYAGVIDLSNGTVGGVRPNDFDLDFAGTLTGGGRVIVVDGGIPGDFKGTPIKGLSGSSLPGSTATVDGMAANAMILLIWGALEIWGR